MRKCPICNRESFHNQSIEGYVERSIYKIFLCKSCGLQFAIGDISDLAKIYNSIYNNSKNISGYSNYLKIYKQIKKYKGLNAVNYLIKKEQSYKFIYEFVTEQASNNYYKVLEIGSGLGYLTYALNEAGIDIVGVDLSSDAVFMAKSVFGDLYLHQELKNINEKFDLIIATELIEHLPNPTEFLLEIKNLLKETGRMIFTTPRKYPEEFDSLWATELPPIHLFWFTSKALKILARRIEMSYFEMNFSANSSRYISNSLARPTLNKELLPLKNKAKVVSMKTLLLAITPSFIKQYYYVYIKKTTRYYSSLGSTIFFGFKNTE